MDERPVQGAATLLSGTQGLEAELVIKALCVSAADIHSKIDCIQRRIESIDTLAPSRHTTMSETSLLRFRRLQALAQVLDGAHQSSLVNQLTAAENELRDVTNVVAQRARESVAHVVTRADDKPQAEPLPEAPDATASPPCEDGNNDTHQHSDTSSAPSPRLEVLSDAAVDKDDDDFGSKPQASVTELKDSLHRASQRLLIVEPSGQEAEGEEEAYGGEQPPCERRNRWTAPDLALRSDPRFPTEPSDVPQKHVMCLYARTVMRKPQGYEAKDQGMRQQGLYCKGCLAPLKPSFSPLRLGRSWDCAKFCYYTGYYYCRSCHPCQDMAIIPSRVLNYWDFTPLSVCTEAKNFLELRHETPLLCVSAVNPKLYELLPVLRATRNLRIQVNMLREIGGHCKAFEAEFFGVSANEEASFREATTVDEMVKLSHRRCHELQDHVIPESKRYLVEDSEFWSLSDLCRIREIEDSVKELGKEQMKRMKEAWSVDSNGKLVTSALFRAASTSRLADAQRVGGNRDERRGTTPMSPTTGSGGLSNNDTDDIATTMECELTTFLRQTRSNMIRHVVQICRRGNDCCFARAAQVCPICKKKEVKELAFVFDINKTRSCTRCGSVYHLACWQRRKSHHMACVVCVNNMLEQSPREGIE